VVDEAFTVRRATMADLETIAAFAAAEASDAEGLTPAADTLRRGVLAGLEDPSVATYWVVETADGEVAGSASVTREWSNWNAADYWWAQSMFVTSAYRGRRLARLLLATIEDAARAAGAADLRLYVHEENTKAIPAYARTGVSDSPYQIMSKRLTPED
jgi:GNAT superfamily N-acetyltransferase